MVSSAAAINRLLEKLERLRRLDRRRDYFGAGGRAGHGYEIVPVDPGAVTAREAALGYSFPAEYRDWLLQVGCGAGPGYGLMPLDDAGPVDWHDANPRAHGGDVARVEDITLAHVAAIHPKRSDVPDYQYASYAHISADSVDHFLAVSDVGCGGYAGMIVAGPLRGKVFTTSCEVAEPRTALCALWPEGVYVRTSNRREVIIEPGNLFGFFDWYEDWLDRGIKDYSGGRGLPFIGTVLARARAKVQKDG
ncbi:SMI1/KNR4 family protein [Sphingosinicella sp. LHD-64]|uniref:SMI1/KNR4 family protein n=1 Tax=Sphingosinicella sp. LHD-64 TaxID=3072139 RepID=UPI00280D8D93|nr:SMI1/KNR4 family protein [Sphingosinicella sp. LHD-64]MDQ8755680.1 SMI1/KNR4 family protein [Sphingosinicella sp. LHD-64]